MTPARADPPPTQIPAAKRRPVLPAIISTMLRRTVALLTLLALPIVAFAAPEGGPEPLPDASRYFSPQSTARGVRVLCPSASTAMIPFSSGGSAPFILPWNSLVTFVGGGNLTVCLHGAYPSDIGIGDQTTVNAVTITDASGPDGNGSCFTLRSAGSTKDEVPKQVTAMFGVGSRAGVCSTSTLNSATGQILYPACRQDSDCTSAGSPAGATCNLTPSTFQSDHSGVYATCRASVDQTDLTVVLER